MNYSSAIVLMIQPDSGENGSAALPDRWQQLAVSILHVPAAGSGSGFSDASRSPWVGGGSQFPTSSQGCVTYVDEVALHWHAKHPTRLPAEGAMKRHSVQGGGGGDLLPNLSTF